MKKIFNLKMALLLSGFTVFIAVIVMALALPTPKNKSATKEIKYRTSFGSCPAKVAGTLTLKLARVFDESSSLRQVKKRIVEENLFERHFLENYKISYDPATRLMDFKYECPEPLMKVQVYKEDGKESYDAILVSNAKLVDPTYEELLREEGKLIGDLPYLAMPVGEMEKSVQIKITEMVKAMSPKFRRKLSEVIVGEDKELTVILSIKDHPASVFLGGDLWNEKISKLERLMGYMESKERVPAIVNLTNAEKIVVKFSDKS